jgi:hypothetical protein
MDRDSYHYPAYHCQEIGRSYQNGLWSASRGTRRYDPSTRRYKEWSIPHDLHGHRIDDQNHAFYPRFTQNEARQIIRRLQRGRTAVNSRMGPAWTTDGPKVRSLSSWIEKYLLLMQHRDSNKSTIGSGKMRIELGRIFAKGSPLCPVASIQI